MYRVAALPSNLEQQFPEHVMPPRQTTPSKLPSKPHPPLVTQQSLSLQALPPQTQPALLPGHGVRPSKAPSLREPAQEQRLPRDTILQPAYHQAPPLPARFGNLSKAEVKGVEQFLFFIGYGRSGHSIVASIMDAHPNIIIAHEYYLFDKLTDPSRYLTIQTRSSLFDELYWSSYHSATSGWRSDRSTQKGYNLNLGGTWQGQFERLKVIGDKTGGSTVMMFHNSPLLFRGVLKRLQRIVGLPFCAVHVVRNPYDMIATVAMYQASSDPKNAKVNATITNKFKQRSFLEMATNIVLTKAAGVKAMVETCHLNVLEIHLEDLIGSPGDTILKMCAFLGVPCPDEYVRACKDKLYTQVSRSRDLVAWPEEIKSRVEMAIQQFTFFKRYSF